MSIELIDELEAGELSVEFEGEEPDVVIEWAIERFAPKIAISTAFQNDGIAVLDMAYAIDPSIRVFSVDTGRLPEETFELIEQLRERYPGLQLELLAPNPVHLQRLVARKGPNLFRESVDYRLLCCNIRKVQPLTRHLVGLDAWITGLRREPVGDAHEHPQGRDRPRPRRDREAEPARRVDRGRGVGLHPRA
jgi:phosphoadenosine phosphosulfate reductase